MVNDGIICRLVKTDHDRIKALQFIEEWFLKWNKCSPPVSMGDILIACKNQEIVGAVNLDFRDEATTFPLEDLYDFSSLYDYFPDFNRKQIVQGGRWSGSIPGVSKLLLHGIAHHCIPRGIRYMIGEVKPSSISRLEELGVKFIMLYGVSPCFETLPMEKQKYYLEPPPLRLMIIRMENLLC